MLVMWAESMSDAELPHIESGQSQGCTFTLKTRLPQTFLGFRLDASCSLAQTIRLVELGEVKRYHADEGDPQQNNVLKGPYQGTFQLIEMAQKVQGDRQIGDLMWEESDYKMCSITTHPEI